MSKKREFIKLIEEGGLCANDILDLYLKSEKLMGIVKAVAHIGVDFGYGKYELEQSFIDEARAIFVLESED